MTMSIKAQTAFRTAEAELARQRRAKLAAEKSCINGASHEKPKEGVRCPWCVDVHRRGVSVVLSDPLAPARPPGHTVRHRDVTVTA
jgi:hypothetical protein